MGKNTSPPQLPYDVLDYIFTLVSPKTYTRNSFDSTTPHYHESLADLNPQTLVAHCLAFSQVCQHWRRVAWAIPTLWNTPLFDSVELGVHMLERTAKTPLTIIWPALTGGPYHYCLTRDRRHEDEDTKFIHAIEDHVEYIEALDLYAPDGTFEIMCDYVLTRSNKLSTLRLHRKRTYHAREAVQVLHYRKRGLSPGITSIVHLSLIDCFIRFPRAVTQHLTTLIVILTERFGLQKFEDKYDIFDILDRTPALESLHLENAILEIPPAKNRRTSIQLPQLRSIFVDDNHEPTLDFLSRIRAPSVQSPRIHVRWDPIEDTDDARTAAFWEETLCGVARGPGPGQNHIYPRVTMTHTEERAMMSAGWEPSVLRYTTESYRSAPAPDPFELSADLRQVSQVYGLVSRHGDWSAVRVLEIQLVDIDGKMSGSLLDHEQPPRGFPVELDDPIADYNLHHIPTPACARELLAAMPRLQSMRLVGDMSGRALLPALAITGTATPVCGELHTLHLHEMSLALSQGPGSPSQQANKLTEALRDAVIARYTHALPITKLCVTQVELQEDGDEIKGEWETHFRQWVAQVDVESVMPFGVPRKVYQEPERV